MTCSMSSWQHAWHQAVHMYVYLHSRSRCRLPFFCRSCSKSLPSVLCRCLASTREHSMYSYSYTRDIGCFSAVSARTYCTFAASLVLMSCMCTRAWQSLAIRARSPFIPSYQASRCFGPASCKAGWRLRIRPAHFETGRPALKRAGLQIGL